MRNANAGSIKRRRFAFCSPLVPKLRFGIQLATKIPFCFPFVLPVISDETEFQGAKHSQTEFGNERKSARGLAHSKKLANYEARFERGASFWSAVLQLRDRFPIWGIVM